MKNDKNDFKEDTVDETYIEGRNPVIEAIRAGNNIDTLYIANGSRVGSINLIYKMAKEKGILIKEVDRKKLDTMSRSGNHQGVIAYVTPFRYSEIEDILSEAKKKNQSPFIIVLDEVEDPYNLGSIIRTAEICGAHGVVISRRRSAGVTASVYKASAGAVNYMKVARVANINNAIRTLKENGVFVYGADMDGKSYCYEADYAEACALVIGSEGKGISRLVKENCDELVRIPMLGRISSFNASVAAGILMYEVCKQKIKKSSK